MEKKIAIFICGDFRGKDGGYIPVVVTEGEGGYRPLSGRGEYSLPWNWGKDRDIAEKMAKNYNEKLGLTEKEVIRLVLESMRCD